MIIVCFYRQNDLLNKELHYKIADLHFTYIQSSSTIIFDQVSYRFMVHSIDWNEPVVELDVGNTPVQLASCDKNIMI